MGFHIAMTVCALSIPLMMLGFGAWMFLAPPDEINHLAGYRTPMSEKNPLTWAFAHRFAGRLWMILGPILLPPSLLLMILLPDGTEDSVGNVTVIVMTVQCIVLLATVAATEIALHRHFDRNGNPK